MHTEQEAKTKWCPFGAGAKEFGENGTNNVPLRVYTQPSTAHCIASACMAWQWVHGNPHEAKSAGGILLPREQWPGYCGAFRKAGAQ
jgi:hypothetical protein